jgi:hypothetical protein
MQDELFHEDISAALAHVIAAIGGMKRVGSELWPSMPVDQAGRKLANCLNDGHQQQLHPSDVLWILSEGRKAGVHSGMAYVNRACGYGDPQPVEPEDEAAELQRQFIAAQQGMNQILKRMEKLALPQVRGVA